MADYTARSSFFDGARELGHSSFWAWVLASLTEGFDPERQREGRARQALAGKLLEKLKAAGPGPLTALTTERKLDQGRGRADIYFERAGQGHIVEFKVTAHIDSAQLCRYRESGFRVALMSHSFDFGWAGRLTEQLDGRLLDMRAMGSLLDEAEGQRESGIVSEYRDWVARSLEEREDGRRRALALHSPAVSSPQDWQEVFWNPVALWYFAGGFLIAKCLETHPDIVDRGTSFGRPWVSLNLRFPNEEARKEADLLFWRFDSDGEGPKLRLRQYNWPDPGVDKADWRARKLRRFETLRGIVRPLAEASLAAAPGGQAEALRFPSPRREKEWSLVEIALASAPMSEVRRAFAAISNGLMDARQALGWSPEEDQQRQNIRREMLRRDDGA